MYIYQLRQKSSGLFFKSFSMHDQPHFSEDGLIFRAKADVLNIKWHIQSRRKQASYLFHNYKYGNVAKYAEEARLLRPSNFEVVTYFCSVHSVG